MECLSYWLTSADNGHLKNLSFPSGLQCKVYDNKITRAGLLLFIKYVRKNKKNKLADRS